jgi:membrane fusion protein, hemolysin D
MRSARQPSPSAPGGGTSRAMTRDIASGGYALLEFLSPSAAVVAMPAPRSARNIVWIVTSMFALCIGAMGAIPIDRVVTAQAKVVSTAATIVVQPLETAIVRSVEVREGQLVHAGDLLARLDPTFAAADAGALRAQVTALEAEVARLKAEANGEAFTVAGPEPAWALQAGLYAQRQAERRFKLENYAQKITSLQAIATKSEQDAATARERLGVATQVEGMRKQLEKMEIGSKLNSLMATGSRMEVNGQLAQALNSAEAGRRDLAAMRAERDGYDQNWQAEVWQNLADRSNKLTEARQSLNKAGRRQQLMELRAERDATVLTVAKASVGSVLQSGDQLITMAPAGAPLELEANIAGHDDGFVHEGDPAAIKFDTFPFAQYGLAHGTVRMISADSFTGQDEARSRSGWATSVPVPGNNMDPYFRARITIDRLQLRNLPANFHLQPGMPVTADIKIGKRTVLSYLLGRVLPVASEAMREP